MMNTEDLFKYDQSIRTNGVKYLAGVDEAGRGPLAGPVVAAAVIFHSDQYISGVNDSKQLSENKRNDLYYQIRKKAVCYAIGIVNHLEIDRINILQATFLAMQKAVDKLLVKPDLVLIDGRDEPLKGYNQQHLIKGDSLSYSVAAASILAKVTRDRIMNYYHNYYPIYGFRDNKGYATRKHMSIIQETGRSPLHRKTFLLPFEKSGGQLFLDL